MSTDRTNSVVIGAKVLFQRYRPTPHIGTEGGMYTYVLAVD